MSHLTHQSAVAFLCLVTLASSASQGLAADRFRESRRHWSPDAKLIAERLPAEKREEFLKAALVPKVTVITRQWSSADDLSEQATASAATRNETVVLFDPAVERLRFGWWEDRSWDSAKGKYRLKIWYPDGDTDDIKVTVDYPRLGHDLRTYLAESREAREKGTIPDDDQLPITIDYAGRKLALAVAQWRRGLLTVEDAAWLSAVKRPRLVNALKTIASVSPPFPQLQMACDLVVFPLAGEYERQFEPAEGSLVSVRGRPDCDFDAWFGESCSLKEQMEFDLGKNPQLAPPSK
jgi:hypothetical protein